MQSTRRRTVGRSKCVRWCPKEGDDGIIQRWAEACSEMHNVCLGCPHFEGCQDLVDRLISCMDVQSPGHRETVENSGPEGSGESDFGGN